MCYNKNKGSDNMLKEGTKAPDFRLPNQNQEMINLSDFAGKTVVLYFYPKDNTPGCTRQACAFRDHYQEFINRGVVLIGVSADNAQEHQKFISDHQLPFTLLSDTDHEMINNYEVWVEKNNYGKKYMGISRSTYIIDGNGMIIKVFKNANPDTNAADILNYLDQK